MSSPARQNALRPGAAELRGAANPPSSGRRTQHPIPILAAPMRERPELINRYRTDIVDLKN
jgi:hypothetical protein